MHYGFRLVEHMISGLESWMRQKRFAAPAEFVGKSVPRISEWGDLDLGYKVVAEIDQDKCIHCGLCYIACEDGCHQSIKWDKVPEADFVQRRGLTPPKSGDRYPLPGAGEGYVGVFTIDQESCVGCNMCSLVCPVEECITMKEVDSGLPSMNWKEYQRKLAAGEIDPIGPPQHV
jgi:dihydropyrimidine dehydrogenase (NAD+) subunit PreA